MTVELALPKLFDDVVALMAADAAAQVPALEPVPHVFGWREPAKRPGRSLRIVWVPGDDESGDMGEVGPAKQPGRNPRPLATLHELFTIYVEAQDPSAPEIERAQYQVARELFDALIRAMHSAAFGTYTLLKPRWVIDKKERRFGAAIRILGSIQAAIPDAPLELAPVDVRAVIAVELLDVIEELETAPAPPAARAATTEPLLDLSGTPLVDGVVLIVGDRVLVKDESDGDAPLNGLYFVAAGAWSRAAAELEHGFFVHVEEGDENGDAGFELTTADPIVVDTTPLVFERVSP